MQGPTVVEGFGLAGQVERLLAVPGPFHINIYVFRVFNNPISFFFRFIV